MAKSAIALITRNIVSTLNGKSIKYTDTLTKTLYADRMRRVFSYGENFPVVVVNNPVIEKVSHKHRTIEADLYYQILFYEVSVNDEYNATTPNPSISEVLEDIPSEINRLLTADRTRGGLAFDTVLELSTDYINVESETSDYCIDMEYRVRVILRDDDFTTVGG